MKKIVIIGAGGHAKVVADIILKRKELLNENIEVVGFLDDNFESLKNKEIFGCKVLGSINFLNSLKNKDYLYIIAIGNNEIREKIFIEHKDASYYTAIHPTAVIANDVKIGQGTVVMANAVINSSSIVGKHCIINTGSIIEHDNKIEDFVHISPRVVLCGNIEIGKKTWVGAGSTIINNRRIGKNIIIGAGTVVIRDVENGCTLVGNPGKVIKKKYDIIIKSKNERNLIKIIKK